MEELLHKFNIDKDSLNQVEIETLQKWSELLSKNALNMQDVRDYINSMITSLERDLFDYSTAPMTFANLFFRRRKRQSIEARLHNYVLLRDFLTAPERARSYVEKQLNSFKIK